MKFTAIIWAINSLTTLIYSKIGKEFKAEDARQIVQELNEFIKICSEGMENE